MKNICISLGLILSLITSSYGQTTILANNPNLWQFGMAGFTVINSNVYPVKIVEYSSGTMPTTGSIVSIWSKPGTMPVATGPITAANGWTLESAQNATNTGINIVTVATGTSTIVPAGGTMSFMVSCPTNVTFGNQSATPINFSAGGVTLSTGGTQNWVGPNPASGGTISQYTFSGGIKFQPAFNNDMAVSSLLSPTIPGCVGANQVFKVRLFNNGVLPQSNFPVVVNINGVDVLTELCTATITSLQSYDFTFTTPVNMSANIVYNVKVFTNLATEQLRLNDTISGVINNSIPMPLPYSENFEAGGVPVGYNGNMSVNTGVGTMHGKGASKGMFFNLKNATPSFSEILPKVGPLKQDAVITFDYRVVNWTSYINPGGTATTLQSDDSISLWMSKDCGNTYVHLKTITGIDHTPSNLFKNVKILIKNNAGVNPVFKFTGKFSIGSGGDYYVDMDNINIYNDTNDFTVSTILSPVQNSCFRNSTPVKVMIKNVGTATQSNIEVCAKFSGIYTGTMCKTFTGTLNPNDSAMVYLGDVYVGMNGSLDYKIYTNYVNEDNYSNDTVISSAYSTELVGITTLVMGDTQTCKFNNIDVFASGGVSQLWSNGSTGAFATYTMIQSEKISVISTDVNGCLDTGYLFIKVNPLPSLTTKDDSICQGSYGTVSASGALYYDWGVYGQSKKMQYNPTSTQVFTVIGKDINGCTDTAEATMIVKSVPIPVITNDTNLCSGSMATMLASGGMSYNWGIYGTKHFITVPVTKTQKFPVLVTGGNGCSQLAYAWAYVKPQPTITLNSPSVCRGENAILTASGGVQYNWGAYGNQPSANIVNVQMNMQVAVTVTDQYSCTSVGISEITMKEAPPVVTKDITMCAGATATISATTYIPNTDYAWSGIGNGQFKTVSPKINTTYDVTATDPNGCSSTGKLNVTVKSKPVVKISDEVAKQVCETVHAVNLSAEPVGGYFSGSHASFGAFYPKVAGRGKFKVVYDYVEENTVGCNGRDSIEIDVKKCDTAVGSGIISLSGVQSVRAIPNPFGEELKVELNVSERGLFQIHLMDNTGRILNTKTSDLEPGQQLVIFNTNQVSSGVYHIQIERDNQVFNLPIVIKQ